MNSKRAKAVRKLAQHIAARKGLPEVIHTEMPVGFGKKQTVVAADTQRGQYRALKKAVGQHY
jgi:hypothetical protein